MKANGLLELAGMWIHVEEMATLTTNPYRITTLLGELAYSRSLVVAVLRLARSLILNGHIALCRSGFVGRTPPIRADDPRFNPSGFLIFFFTVPVPPVPH